VVVVYTPASRPVHLFHYCLGEGYLIMMLDRLFRRDRGQGLVEYALIIALVAVVVIGTLILLGPQIASIFQNISNNL
jgi:pilus assembly protein Flp/PilA